MQPHFKKARLSTNGQMSNPMLMGGMMGQGMLPMTMSPMNPMASMMMAGANPMLASMMQAMNHHPVNPGQFHSGVLEEVHEDDDGANGVVEDALAAAEEDESGPGPSDPAMGSMGSVRTKAPPSKPVCPSLQPNQSKPNVSQGFALSIVGDTIEEAVQGVMQARRTLFQAQKDSMPIPRCVKYLGGLPKARHSIHQPYCHGFVESERSV